MSKKVFKGSTLLAPVPCTLITSKNKEGRVNVFTVGWTGICCTKPPVVSIAVRPERLSYDYIKETGEFVINLPTTSMTKIVDFCGVRSGRDLDKIEKFNLQLEEGNKVSVPSLSKVPIALECKIRDITQLGSHHLFIADILSVKVDEDIIDKMGKIHFEKANLLSYAHGEYFSLNPKVLGKFGYSVEKKKKGKFKDRK